MKYINPFVLDAASYQRDLNPVKHACEDMAKYLQLMTGKSEEECRAFVKKSVSPNGKFALKDPRVLYLERGENGDRVKKEGTWLQYLGETFQNKELISPTGTTYLNPKVKESVLYKYIGDNIKKRKVAKKAKFKAEMEQNMTLAAIKDNEQNNKKISNNSISGAHLSPSQPLYNPTGHSTLTSTCRATSGYGNANNEKMLSGNRHYWSADITRNNIVSIVNRTDYAKFQALMDRYQLTYPTVEDVMECIKHSSMKYWRTGFQYLRIQELVDKLSPIQRAAFVYTGDLYHFKKHNDQFTREFITKLATRIVPNGIEGFTRYQYSFNEDKKLDYEEGAVVCELGDKENAKLAKEITGAIPEDLLALAAQICPFEMRGFAHHDLEGTRRYLIFAATAQNVAYTIMEYKDLIDTLLVTENVPASLAKFPESIRHAALTSDTDSTIFTVQDWVAWHQGTLMITNEGSAISASMIFLASQAIVHLLARMSANFGISTDQIFTIAMKNEYAFDIFVPTQVAKHYYALIGCQEGNLYAKYKEEIKGVHLKSSNAPPAINKKAKELMLRIMNTALRGEKLNASKLLKEIADIEREVTDTMKHGGTEYFRKAQINPPESYTKGPTESPYAFYTFWNEVFGPKYGEVPPPPYTCIKISTNLKTANMMKDYLASLPDRELANRFTAYLARNNKKTLGTILLPEYILQTRGIPEELVDVVGIRALTLNITKIFHFILETLGIYKKPQELYSDYY